MHRNVRQQRDTMWMRCEHKHCRKRTKYATDTINAQMPDSNNQVHTNDPAHSTLGRPVLCIVNRKKKKKSNYQCSRISKGQSKTKQHYYMYSVRASHIVLSVFTCSSDGDIRTECARVWAFLRSCRSRSMLAKCWIIITIFWEIYLHFFFFSIRSEHNFQRQFNFELYFFQNKAFAIFLTFSTKWIYIIPILLCDAMWFGMELGICINAWVIVSSVDDGQKYLLWCWAWNSF